MRESPSERKQAAFMLPVDLIFELKHEAVRQRTFASAIVEKACQEYLARRVRKLAQHPEPASA